LALQLLSVTHRYRGQAALEGVSLCVRPGDCYGLIGHNGAGKTTAMRVALGLVHAMAGEVRVDGLDPRREPHAVRARMGGLIESCGFHGRLDARANLELLAGLRGLDRNAARREVGRLLELVGLVEHTRKPVQAFSQGMRQRLGVAQALLGAPRYLLLDEPTNGLDPEGLSEMRALVTRLVREEGVSVLLSSHQLHEVAGLCNRIGVLRQGRMVVEAETRALLAAAPGRCVVECDVEFDVERADRRAGEVLARLGLTSTPRAAGGLVVELGERKVPDVARALVDAGLALTRLGAESPSLEELYLSLCAGNVGPPSAPAPDLETAPHPAPAPPALTGTVRVLRYELRRWRCEPWRLALFALPALVGVITVGLEHARAASDVAAVEQGSLATATSVTAFGASAAALETALPILALLLAGLASQALAGELARGTLRNLLLRPLTRAEAVAGKALAGLGIVAASYAVLVLAVLGAAAAWFDFADLVEILPNGAPFPLVAAAELRPDFLRALLQPLFALGAVFGVGFLASALAGGAASALGLALGALLALDLARTLARTFGGEIWLLTAHLPTPLGDTSFLRAFADRAGGVSNSVFEFGASFAGLPVPRDFAVPCLWWLGSLLLAARLLRRRNVP
jgi:ABC-2 type transport system ATP-binding protein